MKPKRYECLSDSANDIKVLTLRTARGLVPTPSTKGGGGRKGPTSVSQE